MPFYLVLLGFTGKSMVEMMTSFLPRLQAKAKKLLFLCQLSFRQEDLLAWRRGQKGPRDADSMGSPEVFGSRFTKLPLRVGDFSKPWTEI